MQIEQTMYQAVGGEAGLNTLVNEFYTRLWADPDLKGYFEGVDKDALKRHQRAFLAVALGGGNGHYDGNSLPVAHTGLNITDDAFDKVAHHLWMTMKELKVDGSLMGIIAGFVEGKRSSVVMVTDY